MFRYACFLSFICIVLFLVACGDGGTSEPILYPEQSLVKSSSSDAPEYSGTPSSSDNVSSSSSSVKSSSSKEKSSSSVGLYLSHAEMTDERDGNVYKTLTIEGVFSDKYIPKQTWMIENLNFAYLQPTSTLDSSSWCLGNDPSNCEKFGRLYLWSAAIDSAALFSEDADGCGFFSLEENWHKCQGISISLWNDEKIPFTRGVCPEGRHLPTYDEELSVMHWRYCCDMHDEFNYQKAQFSIYDLMSDYFDEYLGHPALWVAMESDYQQAYIDIMSYNDILVSEGYDVIVPVSKQYAVAVRCVKDVPDIE